jgi:molecular chaperone DnaK
MARDNKTLGTSTWMVSRLPRAGVPAEVTFDIDANGILNVSAKDLEAEKQETFQLLSSGLTKDEVGSRSRASPMPTKMGRLGKRQRFG